MTYSDSAEEALSLFGPIFTTLIPAWGPLFWVLFSVSGTAHIAAKIHLLPTECQGKTNNYRWEAGSVFQYSALLLNRLL